MATLEELLKQVGRPYEMFNEDGTCQGCLYPLYFLYSDIPCYTLNSTEKNYDYGIEKIRRHFNKIEKEELKPGDIIAARFKDNLHVAVYLEFGKVIQAFENHSLSIGRLKMFKDFECYRVKNGLS